MSIPLLVLLLFMCRWLNVSSQCLMLMFGLRGGERGGNGAEQIREFSPAPGSLSSARLSTLLLSTPVGWKRMRLSSACTAWFLCRYPRSWWCWVCEPGCTRRCSACAASLAGLLGRSCCRLRGRWTAEGRRRPRWRRPPLPPTRTSAPRRTRWSRSLAPLVWSRSSATCSQECRLPRRRTPAKECVSPPPPRGSCGPRKAHWSAGRAARAARTRERERERENKL